MVNRVMISAISKLLSVVEESVNPGTFSGQHLSEEQLNDWKYALDKELKILKQAYILTLPNNDDQHYFLAQLISLSNTMNGYLFRWASLWEAHPQADRIKLFYRMARNIIEQLIDDLLLATTNETPDLAISDYSIMSVVIALKAVYKSLYERLQADDIDPGLRRLLLDNLLLLIRRRHLTYRDAAYIENLCAAIMQLPKPGTNELKQLLFTLDFNCPEFFMYWVNNWQDELSDLPGLHEQLEMITLEQEKVNNLRSKGIEPMLRSEASLKTDLQNFLGEKAHLLKQLIKLRRIVLQDNELARSAARLRINLPVAQFGLFIRLQIESGLLPKENLGQIFNFFAANYSTKQTLFISPESLQKKSTDVEHQTAQKMKGHLIGMVNWLNVNYPIGG